MTFLYACSALTGFFTVGMTFQIIKGMAKYSTWNVFQKFSVILCMLLMYGLAFWFAGPRSGGLDYIEHFAEKSYKESHESLDSNAVVKMDVLQCKDKICKANVSINEGKEFAVEFEYYKYGDDIEVRFRREIRNGAFERVWGTRKKQQ